jgi:hypothetical protein
MAVNWGKTAKKKRLGEHEGGGMLHIARICHPYLITYSIQSFVPVHFQLKRQCFLEILCHTYWTAENTYEVAYCKFLKCLYHIRFKMGSHSGSFLSYLGHLCVNILRMFDISFSFKWLTECPSQYWACMSMWSPQSLLHERALSTCKFVATFSHCKKRSRDTKKEKSGIDLLKCLLWDCNINEFIIIYWMLWIGVLVLL